MVSLGLNVKVSILVQMVPIKNVTSHIGGLERDCINSSVLALELLQSCAKPSISNLDNPIHVATPLMMLK